MSIVHASSCVVNAAAVSIPPDFNPVTYGRIESLGITALADGSNDSVGSNPNTCDTEAGIWVIQTADNCYIRVGAECVIANTGNVEDWYNSAGTDQGNPGPISGSGANVFELGTICDTVRINRTTNTIGGTPSYAQIGSYTNNSFFAPTTNTKYGARVDSTSFVNSPGANSEFGETKIATTFRKTGQTDYTITFDVRADATSFNEP